MGKALDVRELYITINYFAYSEYERFPECYRYTTFYFFCVVIYWYLFVKENVRNYYNNTEGIN